MEILNYKNNKYGYTLLELLIVLAILAIILSICIPNTKIICRAKENKELMEFRKDIIYARNSAITENKPYILNIDIERNGYYILKIDKKAVVVKNKQFDNGIILKRNNFDGSITFISTGMPNRSGTITLTNKKNQIIKVTITPTTGKVNVYKVDV